MIICFEGIDGSGKNTHIRNLKNRLIKKKMQPLILSFPDSRFDGGKELSEILSGKREASADEQFGLFLSNIEKKIKSPPQHNKTFVLNRYVFSTLAYQGALGFNIEQGKTAIEKKIKQGKLIKPDIAILLDLDVQTSLKRIKLKKKEIFETKEFLEKVRKNYNSLAKKNFLCRWAVIDASRKKKEVFGKILSALNLS